MKPYIVGCLGLILIGGTLQAQPMVAAPAPVKLTLPDQFEQTHDLGQYRGHVVVLLYGDRTGMPSNRDLGEKLHVEFHPTAKGLSPAEARKVPPRALPNLPADKPNPNVYVIPVACIGNVPNVVRTVVRGQIKKGSPEVPVWLDFEERMKQNFGMADGVPNLVVIDAYGRLRFRAQGVLDAATYQRVTQIVEYLRQESAGLVQPAR